MYKLLLYVTTVTLFKFLQYRVQRIKDLSEDSTRNVYIRLYTFLHNVTSYISSEY